MKIIHRLYRHYMYHMKLVDKFVYMIVVILLTSILIVNVYVKKTASVLITQEVKKTTRQFLEQYIDNINFKISKFNTMLSSISANDMVKNTLDHAVLDDSDIINIEKEIRSILNNQFPYGLYEISLYPLENANHQKGSFVKNIEEADERWSCHMKDFANGQYFIHREGAFDVELLTVLKPIYSTDGQKITGVIKLSLFPEKVFRGVAPLNHPNVNPPFIIGRNGEFIYGISYEDMGEYISYVKNRYGYLYNGIPVADYQSEQGSYITSLTSSNGYRAVYYFSYEDTADSLSVLNRMLTIFILVLLLLICLSASFLSVSIGRRMQSVIQKMKQISSGQLEILKDRPGEDEIGIIDETIYQMSVQLKKLIEDNYISEMKKKDAQFMALQAQINPHFLFNSLEIVNSLIEVEEYDTAVLVNAKLSELLRYSINHNSAGIVTIKEEIDYMNNYVYIQNIRFTDKFTFHLDVESACLHYKMIKLIFQPFIENSLKHGLSGRNNGNIWFLMKLDEDNRLIKLTIADDGRGVSPKKLETLIQSLEKSSLDFEEKRNSIGLQNINYRMRLKYGERYYLKISSEEGRGMRIQMGIPAEEI